MKSYKLFDNNKISWYVFGRDELRPTEIIDTNEYAIFSKDEVFLLDPGGTEIFPSVLSSVTEKFDLKNVTKILCSHQDPDIFSSMPLWQSLCPNAKVYVSWIWSGFVSHFGKQYAQNFIEVPDHEIDISFGEDCTPLKIILAHYCHSSGNLNLFDPNSQILFTGDIGSALLPPDYPIIVNDFDQHIQYMEKFHIRWMPSNNHKNAWIGRVRRLKPKMLCPQHGSIFQNENVNKFLDWFETLDVGKY